MLDLVELFTHWQSVRSQVQLAESLEIDRQTIAKRRRYRRLQARWVTEASRQLVDDVVEGDGLTVSTVC